MRDLWASRREKKARDEEPEPGKLPVRVHFKKDARIVNDYIPHPDHSYPTKIKENEKPSNTGARLYVASNAKSPGIYTTWCVTDFD
jgi:hypothetical protein